MIRAVRSAVFNAYFYGLTTIMILVLPLVVPRGEAVMQAHIRRWAHLALGGARLLCGITWRVTGREHLPAGPALIVSRHQSAFDTIVWFLVIGKPAPTPAYVLKQELATIPLMGKFAAGLGLIPVDRSAGATAIRALLRGADAALRAGRSIVIFPEGTRAPADTMLPLQPGVAALAQRVALPVIPVGTDSGRFWGRRAFIKNPGTITIEIRPALPAGLSREALMRELRAALAPPPEG